MIIFPEEPKHVHNAISPKENYTRTGLHFLRHHFKFHHSSYFHPWNHAIHLTLYYVSGIRIQLEKVCLPAENFPNQTVRLLRKDGFEFEDPEIVAKTGWTTDELQAAIDKHSFKDSYDLVTLLIGVNNQYRGRTVENYRSEFESLVKQAIQLANGKAEHVIVLSIPDWGATPFARDRDTKQIAVEIDNYNSANKAVAERVQGAVY